MAGTSWPRCCAGAADELDRRTWSGDRIEQTQRAGLRDFCCTPPNTRRSTGSRLAGIDIDGIEPADLSALPVMTKPQMMDAIDDVFTDRRLAPRATSSRRLPPPAPEPVPILDDYIALASGGCSGQRGIFVLDRAAAAAFFASVSRPPGSRGPDVRRAGRRRDGIRRVAVGRARHRMSRGLTSRPARPSAPTWCPRPYRIAEVVERLNASQPAVLTGYASMLVRLAAEASAGRLRIAPAAVSSTSETLLPEMRSVIRRRFGVPVLDGFGSTEGLVGKTCADDDVFVFNTDFCIVELVDAENRPVPPGAPSAKVLVTNLYNGVQPLIRYELTDTFIRQPDAAEHGYLRARVWGRSDDVLRYGAVDVHPIAIRSVMVKTPEVIDYQVRQTRCGIDVIAVTDDGVCLDGLSDRLRRALVDGGLARPNVTVRPVDSLDRHPVTGKLRRFVPITTA